jgi:hypothetical protein
MQPQPRAMSDWFARTNGTLVPRVFVSATQGTGLDLLRDWIARAARGEPLSPASPPPHEAGTRPASIAGQCDPSSDLSSDPRAQTTGIA